MFALSYPDAHKLHKDAIKKFIGKSALLLYPDGYDYRKECDEIFLERIHRHKVPYIVSDCIVKNEAKGFTGAVKPDYGVDDFNATIIIKDKKVIVVGQKTLLEDVYYDNTSFAYKPPARQGTFDKMHNDDIKYIQSIGTTKFKENYCYWAQSAGRWCYEASKTTHCVHDILNVYVSRLGFYDLVLIPSIKDLAPADKDNHARIKKARVIAWKYIADAQASAKTEHAISPLDYTEIQDYKLQVRAGGLILSVINTLAENKKILDIDNLYYILASVKPSYGNSKSCITLLSYCDDLITLLMDEGVL